MERAWEFTVIVACVLAAVLAVSGTLVLQAQREARLTAERDAAVAALESKIASERTTTDSEPARLEGQVGKPTTLITMERGNAPGEAATLVAVERERAASEEAGIQWQLFDLELRTVSLELGSAEWQLSRVGEQLQAIEAGLRQVEDLLASVRRGLVLRPQA